MNQKLSAALKTFGKFILWSALAAAATAAAGKLDDILPVALVSLVAAVLKSIATFAATQAGTK